MLGLLALGGLGGSLTLTLLAQRAKRAAKGGRGGEACDHSRQTKSRNHRLQGSLERAVARWACSGCAWAPACKEQQEKEVAMGPGRSCAVRLMVQPLPGEGRASGAAQGGTSSTGSKDEKKEI